MRSVFLVGAARNRHISLAAHANDEHIHIVKAVYRPGEQLVMLSAGKIPYGGPAVAYIPREQAAKKISRPQPASASPILR